MDGIAVAQFKVVVTDFGGESNELDGSAFRAAGLDVDLVRCDVGVDRPLLANVVDADALLVTFFPIDRPLIATLTRCRVISRFGVGVDMIDIDAATERGIAVANVPDFCTDEVSTQAIGFIVDLNRRTFALHEYVRSGGWGQRPVPVDSPRRLRGQVLGVIGLGRIGRATSAKAIGLGLRVVAYDPYVEPGKSDDSAIELVSLDDLLRVSDYVVLHCPLVAETRGLIGEVALSAMKSTAYLINMARGPVVDQRALRQALADRRIGGAALDVLESEPPATDDPLLQMPNVIITPHTGAWSVEATLELKSTAVQNVIDALQGRVPRWAINRQALFDNPLGRG